MLRTREVMPPYFLGLRILKKNPEGLTAQDLSEEVKIAKRNILAYIKLWRKKDEVFIIGWVRPNSRGDWVPVYGLKPHAGAPDARKPKPLNEAQKQARYREKHRAMINAKRRYRRAKKLGLEMTPFSHLTARSGFIS
jgi:hypothetical protein